jgi:hypothetical protein
MNLIMIENKNEENKNNTEKENIYMEKKNKHQHWDEK